MNGNITPWELEPSSQLEIRMQLEENTILDLKYFTFTNNVLAFFPRFIVESWISFLAPYEITYNKSVLAYCVHLYYSAV